MFSNFDWVVAIKTSPIMMSLLAASIITFAVIVERMLYFRSRGGNADALLATAAERIRAGKFADAMRECDKHKHPLGPVAHRVLESMKDARGSSEEYLQVALSEQKLLMERSLGVLGSMAAIAPLVGLLGTVWGIMRAFHDMSLTGSAAPSVVAAGVSEALLTTAAGLIVAVPAVLFYNHFIRRMTVSLTVAENHARSLRAIYLECSRNEMLDTRPKSSTDQSIEELSSRIPAFANS